MTGLAWTQSAMGAGFVVGGLLLGVWGGFRRRILAPTVMDLERRGEELRREAEAGPA